MAQAQDSATRPMTFKVQRARFTRTYELDEIKQLTDDVAAVIAHPVYKNGRGRPRTVGHLVLQAA